MKKPIFLTAILCVMALQSCTTNHYHYDKSGNIGIAEPLKGATGVPGKQSDAATLKAQRKAEVDRSLLSQSEAGAKGSEGNVPLPGTPAAQSQSRELSDSGSFDIPFVKKAVLSVLQWCIVARCGS